MCGLAMEQREVTRGVRVDWCEDHGIWLDRGELETLLGRSDAGQLAESIARRFGRAVVHGAGFHTGGRLINGLINAVIGRD